MYNIQTHMCHICRQCMVERDDSSESIFVYYGLDIINHKVVRTFNEKNEDTLYKYKSDAERCGMLKDRYELYEIIKELQYAIDLQHEFRMLPLPKPNYQTIYDDYDDYENSLL